MTDYLLFKKAFICGVSWHSIIAKLSKHRDNSMSVLKQKPHFLLRKHTWFAFDICISNKAWQTTTWHCSKWQCINHSASSICGTWFCLYTWVATCSTEASQLTGAVGIHCTLRFHDRCWKQAQMINFTPYISSSMCNMAYILWPVLIPNSEIELPELGTGPLQGYSNTEECVTRILYSSRMAGMQYLLLRK